MGLVDVDKRGVVVNLTIDKSIKIGGNANGSNINTGDNTKQDITTTLTVSNGIAEEAFLSLFQEIEKISDATQKETAKFLAGQLKEAHSKQDEEMGSKLISLLKGTLTHSASLAQIASLFM
jgi:hypothetical protein